jgi:serralysin
MVGGAGNDLYIVDNAGDTIEENEDEGIDTVSVTATVGQLPDGYTLAANVENLILGGTTSLSGYGNDLNNRLVGNSANNILDGLEGDNTLDGGVGRDTLRGGSGNDYYIVDNTLDGIEDAGGYDLVEARVANYMLADGMESLVLGVGVASGAGNAENNILVGNSVANTLRGLDGDDTLDGGLGVDSLVGGNGDDYYIVDNAGDRVTESTVDGGTDTVEARVTGYTLANGVENLVLFGTLASETRLRIPSMAASMRMRCPAAQATTFTLSTTRVTPSRKTKAKALTRSA